MEEDAGGRAVAPAGVHGVKQHKLESVSETSSISTQRPVLIITMTKKHTQ